MDDVCGPVVFKTVPTAIGSCCLGTVGIEHNEENMTITKFGLFGISFAALVLLSACGESEKQLAAAQSYSCTQLAREIGKREQKRDSAQVDGFINTIESVVSDNKELKDAADIDATINMLDEADAEKSLEQLGAIYRSKGCV